MPAPDPALPPGTKIAGRYIIVERKGSGAKGSVYSAISLYNGQHVALKFLGDYPEEDDLDAVVLEIAAGQLISHPNVCRLEDVGTTAVGGLYLAMEYVDGQDLAEALIQHGHPPRDVAIRKAVDICSGLAGIHARKFVHRDLKPANVMIDKQGRAKITDLGAVARAGLSTRLVRGTKRYMAPEQWGGAIPETSADIYSLGLLLFELFTGKCCLSIDGAKTGSEILKAHADARLRRPSSEADGVDLSIDHIVQRCLAKEPGDRPTADQLRQLLS